MLAVDRASQLGLDGGQAALERERRRFPRGRARLERAGLQVAHASEDLLGVPRERIVGGLRGAGLRGAGDRVLDGQPVPDKRLADLRLDPRRLRAREHLGERQSQREVRGRDLREVGGLRGAREDRDDGQHEVLHEHAPRDVAGSEVRLATQERLERRAARPRALLAQVDVLPVEAHATARAAGPVAQEQGRLTRRRVERGEHPRGAAARAFRAERVPDPLRVVDEARERLARPRSHDVGLDDHEAGVAEEAREDRPEPGAHVRRPVAGRAREVHGGLGPVGRGEHPGQVAQQAVGRLARHGHVGHAAQVAAHVEGEVAQRPLRVEDRRAVHLAPVVVLRGDPEHGDDDASLRVRPPPRLRDRARGLVEREQRSAEEPGLLPRHHDGGARADRPRMGLGPRPRPEHPLPGEERLREGRADLRHQRPPVRRAATRIQRGLVASYGRPSKSPTAAPTGSSPATRSIASSSSGS